MSTIATDRIAGVLTEAAGEVRKKWGWFLAFGIVQIAAGMLAVSFAFSATVASVVTLGVLLLIAAGAQLAAAVWARDWSAFGGKERLLKGQEAGDRPGRRRRASGRGGGLGGQHR